MYDKLSKHNKSKWDTKQVLHSFLKWTPQVFEHSVMFNKKYLKEDISFGAKSKYQSIPAFITYYVWISV